MQGAALAPGSDECVVIIQNQLAHLLGRWSPSRPQAYRMKSTGFDLSLRACDLCRALHRVCSARANQMGPQSPKIAGSFIGGRDYFHSSIRVLETYSTLTLSTAKVFKMRRNKLVMNVQNPLYAVEFGLGGVGDLGPDIFDSDANHLMNTSGDPGREHPFLKVLGCIFGHLK